MVEAKSVVLYGVVIYGRNHHSDYLTVGSWEWMLVERMLAPVAPPPAFKVQYRDARGHFVQGPAREPDASGRWRDRLGHFVSGPVRQVHVQVPSRETTTGRYAAPRAFQFGVLPGDETIIAETKAIIEDVTGHGMYRTPLQAEGGGHNVSIGIQHMTPEEYLGARTYTFSEYLADLRKRLENEWRRR